MHGCGGDDVLMPVYLITLHAYRSWNADHPRGYVRCGEGVLPPDPEMARRYDQRAKHQRVRFDDAMQRVIVDGTRDICSRRNWRLHHAVCVFSHMHALVSWCDDVDAAVDVADWQFVRDTLKRLLGWMLAKHTQQAGRTWFVRKGSRRRVRDRARFDYLMKSYLPDHAQGRRGGHGWSEDFGHYPADKWKRWRGIAREISKNKDG